MSSRPANVPPLPRHRDASTGGADGLLVAVDVDEHDLSRLEQAAGRARVQRRPLWLALVEPPLPITLDAVIHARYDLRRSAARRDIVARVIPSCAGVPDLGFVTVARPWAATAAGAERALQRRLRRLADRDGLELHPSAP